MEKGTSFRDDTRLAIISTDRQSANSLSIGGKVSLGKLIHWIRGVERFHLEPEYFPKETKEWLSREQMLEFQMLPLGIKHKTKFFKKVGYLNVGSVNPKIRELHKEVDKIARERLGDSYGGYQIYQIQESEFKSVLDKIYGVRI
jgi:hypothetical protein